MARLRKKRVCSVGGKKRPCCFGIVKRGRRKGACLKSRRAKGRWTKAGRSGAKVYVKRGR